MNQTQFLSLPKFSSRQTIRVEELEDQSDRTLVYGYDSARSNFHVFLKAGKFYRMVYSNRIEQDKMILGVDEVSPEDCLPDKRVYPESCDFEFCTILISRGHRPPFTQWDENRRKKVENTKYHGAIVK